jgi:signal transduction histidine kinase/GGDEF domain-containing protein/HAMP domain-containing protein
MRRGVLRLRLKIQYKLALIFCLPGLVLIGVGEIIGYFWGYDLLRNTILVSAILFAFLLPIAFISGGILVKSIKKLQRATEGIAQGSLDYPIDIKSGDEMEQLADSFNDMIVAIKEGRGQIAEQSVPLKKPIPGRYQKILKTSAKVTLNVLEDLVKTEDDLELSQQSFHSIVEKSADAIIVVDRNGMVCYVNPAAETIFGRKQEAFVDHPFGMPLNHDRTEIGIFRLRGGRGTGEMMVTETTWLGERAGLVTIHDITERKSAEENLIKLDQLKTDFVSTVSHELRTPLTIMGEYASIISDEIPGKLNPDQRQYLSIIEGNIDRLSRIIEDLLDISRIEAEKVVLKREFVDLASIINDVVTQFKTKADEKQIEFRTVFPMSLPPLYIDADRIRQVFTNLIGNAIKFTPRSGKITAEITDREKEVECRVTDTGIGIAPENLDKVFKRFEQFDRTDGSGAKGTGLGLAITEALIQMHHGRIWVESKPNEGSKFIFTLPRYSPTTLFKEYVMNSMKEAETIGSATTLFSISLNEPSPLKGEFLQERLEPILKGMEGLLRKSLRGKGDIVLRDMEGGVVLFLVNCDKENALRVESRLRQKLSDYLASQGLAERMKLHFGRATYPDDGSNAEELMKKARPEVYASKT